jgi:hypothetical protein
MKIRMQTTENLNITLMRDDKLRIVTKAFDCQLPEDPLKNSGTGDGYCGADVDKLIRIRCSPMPANRSMRECTLHAIHEKLKKKCSRLLNCKIIYAYDSKFDFA